MKSNEVANLYDKIANDYSLKIQSKSPSELFEFINLLPKSAKVIDIGCAAGRDSKKIFDAGFKVIGIDVSKKLLNIAKKNYPEIEFKLADMAHLSFSDRYFGGIYANAVLHHVDRNKMLPVLKEFYRVLDSGGILYISTKTGIGTRSGHDAFATVDRLFTLTTLDELDGLLRKAGFKKIKIYIRKSSSKRIDWNVAFYKK